MFSLALMSLNAQESKLFLAKKIRSKTGWTASTKEKNYHLDFINAQNAVLFIYSRDLDVQKNYGNLFLAENKDEVEIINFNYSTDALNRIYLYDEKGNNALALQHLGFSDKLDFARQGHNEVLNFQKDKLITSKFKTLASYVATQEADDSLPRQITLLTPSLALYKFKDDVSHFARYFTYKNQGLFQTDEASFHIESFRLSSYIKINGTRYEKEKPTDTEIENTFWLSSDGDSYFLDESNYYYYLPADIISEGKYLWDSNNQRVILLNDSDVTKVFKRQDDSLIVNNFTYKQVNNYLTFPRTIKRTTFTDPIAKDSFVFSRKKYYQQDAAEEKILEGSYQYDKKTGRIDLLYTASENRNLPVKDKEIFLELLPSTRRFIYFNTKDGVVFYGYYNTSKGNNAIELNYNDIKTIYHLPNLNTLSIDNYLYELDE